MNIQKMIFINWNPDAAPLKTRLLYATAKENLRAHLNLNGKEIIPLGRGTCLIGLGGWADWAGWGAVVVIGVSSVF